MAVSFWLTSGGSGRSADQRAVAAYVAAIHPWIEEGGSVVAEGVKPRLADLDFGAVTPSEFRAEAVGWKAELERVRTGLDRVSAPAILRPAALLYDRALLRYEAAVDAFVAASYAPPSGIKAAVTAAVPTANRADAIYDRADAIVRAAQRRFGLPTPPPLA